MLGDRIQRLVHEVGPLDITPCHKHFVVTLMVRSTKFKVHIEISDIGGVRATSLLCLLGLGLGLGSILVYRICSRIFQIPASPRQRRPSCQRARRPCHCDTSALGQRPHTHDCSPITPASDSGISSMGQQLSDTSTVASPDSPSVHYSSGQEGVRFRGFHREEYLAYTRLAPEQGADGTYSAQVTVTTPSRGRRSPTTLRRQLRIDIPSDGSQYRLSSLESDSDDLQRFCDDTASIGGFSMVPNYSPNSLFEKNLRLSDQGDSGNDALDDNEIFDGKSTDSLSVRLRNRDEMTGSQTSLGYHSNRHSVSSNQGDTQDNDDSSNTLENDGESTMYWSTMSNLSSLETPEHRSKAEGMTDSGIRSKSQSLSPRHSTPNDPGGEAKMPPAIERIKSRGSSRSDRSHSCSSPLSDCSDLSTASKDLTFKSASVDLSDGASGLVTPDSEIFNHGDVGLRTVQGMEELSEELKALQEDIEDMNMRVMLLSSRENLTESNNDSTISVSRLEAREEEFRKAMTLLRRHRSPQSGDASSSSVNGTEDEISESNDLNDDTEKRERRRRNRYSYHHSGEFMWDYGSDLAAVDNPKEAELFVIRRPLIGHLDDESDSSQGASGVASPTLEHVRAYLKSLDSNASLDLTNASSRQGSLSISDAYIDDDFSRYDISSRNSLQSKESSPDVAALRSPSTSDSEKSPAKTLTPVVSQLAANSQGANGTAPLSIGPKVPIPVYTNREWRGATPKAQLMRQGYMKIPGLLKLNNVCRVRGDNYCAIRATLFQALVNKLPVHQHLGGLEHTLRRLSMLQEERYSYLKSWSFAGRLECNSDLATTAASCISQLFTQLKSVENVEDINARIAMVTSNLNSQPELDVQLMEAVKMLMMLEAIHLHQLTSQDQEVPTFAWLMYARDSSLDPEFLFRNHIDPIGDAHGLEQVEMYLLGHTLGLAIQVVRPSAVQGPDFMTTLSETGGRDLPTVTLIAEDDRHYNVLLP